MAISLEKSRVTEYLKEKYKNQFLFDSLSAEYLKRDGRMTFLKDVPVPFTMEDLVDFKEGRGLSVARMGENMVFVMGMDPVFPYKEQYKQFLHICFDARVKEAFLSDAAQAINKGDLYRAAVLFRGVMTLAEEEKGDALQDALFGYASACTQIYEKLQEPENMAETDEESRAREERCGWFKGESIELYEDLSFRFPDFAPAWYYLGYAYLNMGLYAKAFLTWKQFLEKADEKKQKEEIEEITERMEQLEGPMEIEQGCNAILAGRTGEGIKILEKFKDSKYKTWWPLFFYLGTAYTELGMAQEAIDAYKEVLKLAPSNKDAMINLAEIYEAIGQDDLAEKYRRKALLLDEM